MVIDLTFFHGIFGTVGCADLRQLGLQRVEQPEALQELALALDADGVAPRAPRRYWRNR